MCRLPEQVRETLELLEKYSGDDAYLRIKYSVPTYESCMNNAKAGRPPSTGRPSTPYEDRLREVKFR